MDDGVVFIDEAKFTIPTSEHECSEVMWSFGKSCRTCPLKSCYRNGWKKAQVDVDNKRLFPLPREVHHG
jgi:hypothetical protein